MKRIFKAEIPAWATGNWVLEGLRETMAKESVNEQAIVGQLSYSPHETMAEHGWIQVGLAVIEVTVDLENIVEKQVETLDAKIKKARAEFAKTIMELEAEKAKLLCIEGPGAVVKDVTLDDDEGFPF